MQQLEHFLNKKHNHKKPILITNATFLIKNILFFSLIRFVDKIECYNFLSASYEKFILNLN